MVYYFLQKHFSIFISIMSVFFRSLIKFWWLYAHHTPLDLDILTIIILNRFNVDLFIDNKTFFDIIF